MPSVWRLMTCRPGCSVGKMPSSLASFPSNMQLNELLKKKQALDRDRPGVKRVSAIPTAHMDAYVAEMQRRLAVKQIGSKREFLQEVLKEVRVRGSNISLTYKLPLRTSEGRFFTPLRLV